MNVLLANPLATPSQLSTSTSTVDGIPKDLQASAIFLGCRLTQCAGILLQLPQQIVAQAIVIFTRSWIGPEALSLRDHSVKVFKQLLAAEACADLTKDVSAAALFLVAKPTSYVRAPRSVINTIAYVESLGTLFPDPAAFSESSLDPEVYYISEGEYHNLRQQMIHVESHILRALGFNLDVVLPYTLCITYLQALDVFTTEASQTSSTLSKRAIQHLNSCLQNPQLVYLTHQPPEIACAAIYLAAREVGVKLPEGQWWEVFDCDREKLGFLVVAMRSMEGFVRAEKAKWHGRKIPLRRSELARLGNEAFNGG